MEHHDLESMSASDQGGSATQQHKLREQMQRFQQLNEYCDQAVAEIRASLEGTQSDGS
jgi:arylsulfatase A-like enzyme